MRNSPSSLWLAAAYLAIGARALPRPHPAATYQVVDVGGPTSSSSAAPEIVYETIAITKSSKPTTVTEDPVTVTVTPTISNTASSPASSIASASSSSTAKQESAEIPAIYSTSIEKSPLPTVSLPVRTSAPTIATTTSVAVYVPEKPTSTWTSAQSVVATRVATYSPPKTTSWTEPAAEAPVVAQPTSVWSPQPTSIWSPTPTTAMHTVFETVYVAPFAYSPSAAAKSAFPTFIVPWNGTRHSGKPTLSASHGHSSGLSAAVARKTGTPMDIHLAF